MLTGDTFQIGLGMLIIILACYTFGRLHQWARGAMDRDEAYRDGYDSATKSMFFLATRVSTKMQNPPPLSMTKEMPAPIRLPTGTRPSPKPKNAPPPVVVPPHRAIPQERPRRRGARHAA